MLRYCEFDGIIGLKVVPEDYQCADSFFRAYQATRLLQKSEWLPTTFDKEAVALENFRNAERSCEATNECFRSIASGLAEFSNPSVRQSLLAAKRKVRDLLRGYSPYGFLDYCNFGPGADMSTAGGLTSAYNKLSTQGSVTRDASLFLDFLMSNSMLASGSQIQWDIHTRLLSCGRAEGNKVAFVPKDCKTKRTDRKSVV